MFIYACYMLVYARQDAEVDAHVVHLGTMGVYGYGPIIYI